jgi:high-affinity nickel-transport protein
MTGVAITSRVGDQGGIPFTAAVAVRALFTSSLREQAAAPVRLIATISVVAALHVVGFGAMWLDDLSSSGQVVALGVVLTAYLAGLRHGADCDHLAGISNATRKFVGEGRRPVSVGLAFSLGHSTVVLLVALAVVVGVRAASPLLVEEDNATSAALGVVGGCVAGGFLLLIGLFNLVALRRVLSPSAESGHHHRPVTLVARLMEAPLKRVRHPRHVFVIGFLFGLGFDTATFIGLLALTAASTASGAGTVAVLALPLCFAAGMTLGDTLSGIVMLRLYSNAAADGPGLRGFDVVVTAMSVASALGIGVIVSAATARDAFGLHDPFTAWCSRLNLEHAGFVLIGAFVVLALIMMTRRRLARLRGEVSPPPLPTP